MPHRPGVDDDGPTLELIQLWKDGSAELDSRLAAVHSRIRTLLSADPVDNAHTINRLRVQADRLTELSATASHLVDGLAQQTQAWIDDGAFQRIYAAGGTKSGNFSFTAAHQAAARVLATDTFADVLVATQFIDDDSKRFVREVGRQLTGFKLTTGTPARAQARELARALRPEFERRGMGAVVYRDGSRHSFGEYAEMLIRTKTGMAYNMGTLNQAAALGIRWFELLDGSLCGLTSHHDPELANGLIVDYATAAGYPLSHPNCRRSVNPRPDIRNPVDARTADSVQSPAAREDQRQFEALLRQQAARRRSRRPRRQRPTRASRQAERAKQRARAQALNARRENLDRARAILEAEKAAALESPAAARRWGVTDEQFRNARVVVEQMKSDIRAVAKKEADDLQQWIFNNDLDGIERPPPLRKSTDLVSGKTRYRRDSPQDYDWIEQLDDAELARVRTRYEDLGLRTPDIQADRVRALLGNDWTDGQALDWLVDRWLHEDALRSVASGRVPKYGNINDLLPADYGLEGYELDRIFGVDLDDAAGHVAQVQVDAAERYARSVLQPARSGLPDPWRMDPYDYVHELEATEEWLVQASTATDQFTTPATIERVRARLRELAPPDLDPDGSLHPFDLLESIRVTAQMAGYDAT